MKSLLQINKMIFVGLIAFAIIFILFLFFCFMYNIETKFTVTGRVDALDKLKMYIPSQHIYEIKNDNVLTLLINNKHYSTIIKEIGYDSSQKEIYIILKPFGFNLIPNSVLSVEIVVGKTSLLQQILGNV